MPVVLASRLTSRTPSPPLRSSGTGALPRVSMIRSISRNRSMAAPAATASASAAVVDVVWSTGVVNSTGPGASPRITWPTTRGRITVSASMRRNSPASTRRGTGRSGGVSGAASRVRPMGEPSSSRASSSLWASSSPPSSSAISSALRSVVSTAAWPTNHGRPDATSGATLTAASPHARARSRRSSSAVVTSPESTRSPNSPLTSDTGTGWVSACRTSNASRTASRRKSRESVAALTD